MRVLLDTHALLWWLEASDRLSPRAYAVIGDRSNEVFISAVVAWEVATKTKVGKLRAVADPTLYLPEQMALGGMLGLPITVEHALHVHTLPLLHRDPFDRLLVAQSQVEGLPIVTCDRHIARYDVAVVW